MKLIVKDINVSFQVEQSAPGSILNPNFGGLSVEEINELILSAPKAKVFCAFRPDGKDNPSWDVTFKPKDFKGKISLSKSLALTFKGDVKVDASAYAYGLLEDDGKVDMVFSVLDFPEQMIGIAARGNERVRIAQIKN